MTFSYERGSPRVQGATRTHSAAHPLPLDIISWNQSTPPPPYWSSGRVCRQAQARSDLRRAPAVRLAPAVHVEQAGLQAAVGRQALVQVEQLQRGARVLDGVVRGGLDVQTQQVAGQEAQAQAALALEAEQVARVA